MNIFLLGTVLLSLLSQVRAQDNARLYQWNKTVPYFFSGNVTAEDKVMIQTQMKLIEDNTCVEFKEVTQQSAPSHRLKITVGEVSCWAGFVGDVSISSNTEELHLHTYYQLTDQTECETDSYISGGVINKLFRVLGAIDTHRRLDRDQYVDYNEDCFNYPYVFTKSDFNLPSDDIPYKCNSIMHIQFGFHHGEEDCPWLTAQDGNDDCKVLGSNVPIPEDWKMLKTYQCGGE